MKAIVWDKGLRFVEDYPPPEPKKGEALIRVIMAGICNTDLEIMKGYMGFTGILGHEFVGVVEVVTGDNRCLIGRRVVGEINCGCGMCPAYCLKGLQNHCPGRTTLGIAKKDGAFAEYITLPEGNLYEVPDNLSDEEAVFTEPLAAAFEITDQIHVKPTDRVLVIGDGKLGLLCALALKLTGADVSLAGRHGAKLEIAQDQQVTAITIEELIIEKIYDIVVEATGRPDGLATALKLVRPRGTIVLKSTVADERRINLTPVVVDEIHLVGSRCGPFKPALRAMSKGGINVKPLISGIFPFSEAPRAFEKARERESLKIIIDFR
ncbi:MAG: alcohol dehydrogenase [Syntrophus sp. (in: bacteria)]|nr:alcohol dehydrogenase [Syntrophus sp. (in: bacteria)]